MLHPLLLPFCRLAFLVALVALGGCRSEQVAFQFRVAESAARPIKVPAQPVADSALYNPALVVPPLSAAAATAPVTTAHRQQPKKTAATLSSRPVRRPLLMASRSLLPKSAAASKPKSVARHETRHLLIGLAVVAAGVVTGLLLGGWLGLGVGALIVIVGYYFLGMAFGGEHAWLEVFQEFFNM